MRQITKIIIQLVDATNVSALIEKHLTEGMTMVGFHYMIGTDGNTEVGRSISTIGNHYIGENSNSIGVALIGKELTKKQESAIDTLLEDLSIKGVDTDNVFVVENGELKKYK